MATDYKVILEQEIAALKRKMNSYSGPKRQEAQECYDIISQPLYAPKSYVDIVEEVSKIIAEVISNTYNLRESGEGALANLIVFRTALVLPLILENARKALPEFYEYIKVQDDAKLDMYINASGSTAKLLSRVQAHRAPLDLLVNKAVRIQGDPFEEIIEFSRKLELDLRRYRKEGTFGPTGAGAGTGTGDPVVEQAFQRIVHGVAALNAQKRRQQLAEKCLQLKMLFPDAADQIDRMFRQESESLDEP